MKAISLHFGGKRYILNILESLIVSRFDHEISFALNIRKKRKIFWWILIAFMVSIENTKDYFFSFFFNYILATNLTSRELRAWSQVTHVQGVFAYISRSLCVHAGISTLTLSSVVICINKWILLAKPFLFFWPPHKPCQRWVGNNYIYRTTLCKMRIY